MATELETTNKQTTRQIWDSIESGDLDELDEVLHEDIVLRVPGQDEIHGRDGYKEYVRSYSMAFPDTSFDIHEMYVDGDTVVTHFTWRGTHEGEMEGIEATGESVAIPGITINRFEDGMAVEDINFWDNLEFFEQLGMLESPLG